MKAMTSAAVTGPDGGRCLRGLTIAPLRHDLPGPERARTALELAPPFARSHAASGRRPQRRQSVDDALRGLPMHARKHLFGFQRFGIVLPHGEIAKTGLDALGDRDLSDYAAKEGPLN